MTLRYTTLTYRTESCSCTQLQSGKHFYNPSNCLTAPAVSLVGLACSNIAVFSDLSNYCGDFSLILQ